MKFGIANNCYGKVRVCTPELLARELDSKQVANVCAEIEDTLEAYRRGELTEDEFDDKKGELKKKLPIITPHATFRNGGRADINAIPSGLSMYDLDGISNPRGRWAQIEARKEELGILLAHVTPSTEGLRLVFVMPQGMDLAQAQAWMAGQLGDAKYDDKVKDLARCSFLVPREYILFMDEEKLFSDIERPCLPVMPKKGEDAPEPAKPSSPCPENYPSTYEEIPYDLIVEVLEEQMGGRPEHGSRNNFIFSMACHLRYVCNDDALWIARILPDYGEAQGKWMSSIKSACNRSQTKRMSRIMRRTLAICKNRHRLSEGMDDDLTPPPMPRNLPPLIKLLVSRTPEIYKPAVAHAVFPALATHLWHVVFKYIDNTLHEATLSNILMAGTGAGKSCICPVINAIMADIRARDKINMERERKWKQDTQSKGANKDKKMRPDNLIIQEIDPDATNAAFVQRLADAQEHFLYAMMNEIELFNNLSPRASSKGHYQLMCLAFDYGNSYGQTRVGTGSVSERVCVRFNYNISTTIRKGQAYFRSVLTDGPISRLNFCTIPEQPIGSDMPVYGTYDASFDEELRPYIERLNNADGLVESRQVNLLAKKLKDENAEFARLSQSRVFENLSFRANVIAFLKAMVLFIAHGGVWNKTMEDFIRWSLKYDLWCKMKFFGNAIEEQEYDDVKGNKRGPQNLLDLLPEVFSREEAGMMRQNQGIRHGSLKSMLSNWKRRGYIELYGEEVPLKEANRQRYIKTPAYLKDHPQK